MNALLDRGDDRFCLTLAQQLGLINLERVDNRFGLALSGQAGDLLEQSGCPLIFDTELTHDLKLPQVCRTELLFVEMKSLHFYKSFSRKPYAAVN